MKPAFISLFRSTCSCAALLALAACSSGPNTTSGSGAAPAAGMPGPVRTVHDGPPSYMQDVSQIPDAVPVPHTGRYKAAPIAKRVPPPGTGPSFMVKTPPMASSMISMA